ncbi:hypothetical protein N9H34_00370 [bacterium]|nr:hypothetical protein [bacterium]
MKSFKDHLEEGGLWDNIHAKRKRIKGGAKERMRKPGSKGAPTAQDFRDSQNEEKEKGVDGKACWKGYKRMGTKKKGGKTVDNCVPEEAVSVQPMSGPTGSMFAMKKEGKEHSWKSEGHYTKDGKEWTGPQHAHNGQVMTGEKHTADSQNLYHYKELSKEAQDKVEKKHEIKEDDASSYEPRKSLDQIEKDYSKGAKKPTDVRKYKAAKPDTAAIKRRKAIEKHQARKKEKDYWDDDTDYTKGCPILEKLDATKNSIGDYVKDFSKSDAPQFKGRSSSKRRQMAVASYLKSKRRDGERKLGETIKYNSDMGAMDWGTPAGTDYMKDVTPGQKNPKEDPVKPLEQSTLKKLNVKDEYVREETEAGETKAEYRKDNAEDAPELGDYALTKQDIKELEQEADRINWELAIDLGMYDPDELDDDLNSADPYDDLNITEVLSVQGRLKRKFTARKNRQRLKVARGIALRRGSSPDRLKKRAQRGAKGMIYKRLLKGRDKSKLPPAEKGRLEKLIGMYAPLVSRLATRMLPGMRKLEINRMKNRKGGAQKAKKYKAARPTAKKQTAKKFKIKR